jgi:hypothetical protein
MTWIPLGEALANVIEKTGEAMTGHRTSIPGYKLDKSGKLVRKPSGNLPANIARAKAADKRSIRPVPKGERSK